MQGEEKSGCEPGPYALADRIVGRLQQIAPFPADDRFWQQARAIIATEITLARGTETS